MQAFKRGSSFALLFFFLLGLSPTTLAESGVSRLDFTVAAVRSLYGDVPVKYAISLRGVPLRSEAHVGLSFSLQALQGWERSGSWSTQVTRGQAVRSLFALAQLSPDTPDYAPFRDVQGPDVPLADQADAWDLLDPLTPGYFGWNRTLTSAELSHMLESVNTHLDLPLAFPPATPLPPQNSPRPRTVQPRLRNGETPSKTIDIEFFIDSGSRVRALDLPKNDLLTSLWGLVQAKYLYLDRVDEVEMGYSLAEKLMGLLGDPYSTFMRPSSAQSFKDQLQGKLSGIGAQVELHPEGGVLVVTPLVGSPALQAGVSPGDRIISVNGETVVGLTLQQGVEKIRGPVGTTVELTIERSGGTITIKVVRAEITLPEIEVTEQDGVTVIKLYQFGERTIRELRPLLEDAMKQKPIGVVLDLRNNPGGLLDGAVSVLGHFVPEGTVVAKIRSRNSTRQELSDTSPVIPPTLPVVVIVNKGSASASEIVAGALQDLKRATVLGVQSYGKGTVQEVTQFDSGESMKLTTGEWLTPDGRSIEKLGITPDILMEEEKPGARDAYLLRAIELIKMKARG